MNKFFKRLALLLAVLMIVSMMPVHLFADNSVTGEGQSNGTGEVKSAIVVRYFMGESSVDMEYDSNIASAVSEIVDNMAKYADKGVTAITVTLNEDVKATSTLTFANDVTFDLNGHTLTVATNGDGIVVNNAALTLTNSGTTGKYVFDCSVRGSDGIFVNNTEDGKISTLNINSDVEIHANSNVNSAVHALAKKGEAIVNINAGKIVATGSGKQFHAIHADQNSTVNINDGEFDLNVDFTSYSENNDVVGIAIYGADNKQENITVNINGGTFKVGGKNAFAQVVQVGMSNGYSKNCTVNISGGEVILNPTENGTGYVYATYKTSYATAEISGGKVSGKVTALVNPYMTVAEIENDGLTISGGTFTTTSGTTLNVEKHLAEDATYDAETGTVKTNYVATVNGVGYATLAEAIAAATPDANGVITYEISGKAEISGADQWISFVKNAEGVTAVKFVGMTADAEISITSSGSILGVQGVDVDVSFENLTLSHPNGAWVNDLANATNYFACMVRRDGHTVTYTNCTFPNGACNNQFGKTVFNDCKFTSTTGWSLWNTSTGTSELNNCSFTGKRGIKLYAEGPTSAAGSVTVKDTTFVLNDSEKAAIEITKPGSVALDNISVSGTTAGTIKKNLTDGYKSVEKVTVTATGTGISGTFNGTTESGVAKEEFNISAGTFTSEVSSDYLADGFELKDNGNGTYGVKAASVAKIGTVEYASLDDAIKAAKDGNVIVVNAGEYNLNGSLTYTGKAFTIKAADGAKVSFDMSAAVALHGAKITFDGVTFDYKTNDNYIGIQHADTLVYKNCTINGQVFLYATNETFNGCKFYQTSADAYNVWTYGAKNVKFNGCTFNCFGKSVLLYNEGTNTGTDLTVTGTTFNAYESVAGKAAIEIDTSRMTGQSKITVDKATADKTKGFDKGSNSGNSLWNDKKQTAETNKNTTVIVNGETVFEPAIIDLDTFIKKLVASGYDFDGKLKNGGKLTVKWSPVSGCFDEHHALGADCPKTAATGNTPKRLNSGLLQFQLFKDLNTAVIIKNVKFVYEPADVKICVNSGWKGSFTAEQAPAGQLYFMTTGDVTVESCDFEKVVFTTFNTTGTSTVKDCTFKDVYNSYAIKDIRGEKVSVTGTIIENCGGGIMVSSIGTVSKVTITGNKFNNVDTAGTAPEGKVGTRAILQIASSGDYASTAFDFSGNSATSCGPVIRQLNKSVAPVGSSLKYLTEGTNSASGLYTSDSKVTGYVEDENGNVTISTAEGLFWFAKQVNSGNNFAGKTVKLANDIDLNNERWTPIGIYNDSKTHFKGTFDGQNHTVSGLNVVESGKKGVGFFGKAFTGTIKNLTVEGNITADGCDYVGGIVGHGYATITNCVFKGDITNNSGYQIGGIAGSGGFTITNCSVYGNIHGESWVGGIAGNVQDGGAYINCYVEGVISANSSYDGASAAGIAAIPLYKSQKINGCYSNTIVKCGDEVINAPIIGCYNGDNNITADTELFIHDNSWNKQKNPNDSYEVKESNTVIEGKTVSRDNNLIMLEDDLKYVEGDLSAVRIMAGSAVTQEQVDALAVAQIGDRKYTSLDTAIAAANAGETVKLLADVTEDVVITANKNITLDLGGKKLNGGTGNTKATITNYGTITIIDSSAEKTGTIKRDDNGTEGETSYYVIRNFGTMTIEQANIINNSGYKKTNPSGSMVGSSLICNGDDDAYSAVLNIKGGTIRQDNFIAIKNGSSATLNVTGGKITSKHSAVQNWCNANITGGELNGQLWTDSWDSNSTGNTVMGGDAKFTGEIVIDITGSIVPKFKITGGTLDVTNWGITTAAANAGAKPAVSGGTFSSAVPEEYCADRYIPTQNADGTYGVKEAMKGSKKNPYTLKELGAMTRADYIAAQKALGGKMYVEIGDYSYDKNGVLGNGVRNDTPGQTEDRSVLNGYNSNGYLGEKNDGANGKNIIFVGGSVTSGVTGYASIDNIGTSLLLAVPAYTNVTFEGTTFNNVMSFDYQLYTGPWSQLGKLKFSGCTFNGLIVGAIAAQTLTFDGCEFTNYTNTTEANNSNPTWIRPAYGNWSKGDNEGQGSDFKSLTTINFTNNTVTSTRPVKFEYISQWDITSTVTATGNYFDITKQSGDTSIKNVGLYLGAHTDANEFHLVAANNTKSKNTAALYTIPSGKTSLPVDSTVKNTAGESIELTDALKWKATDAEKDKIVLKTVIAVASIGERRFATLEEAVAAVAKNGEEVTIKLLSNITAGGIDVAAGQNIVFDFDGHTYTLDGSMVGSTGTKTNGFRFLKGSTVVLKNGTLANGNGSPAKAMINSYATLKLVDFSVDARTTAVAETGSAYGYAALYISNGVTTVTGNGNYTTSDDNFVILIANVGDYTDGASLVFDENYTGTVSGRVSTGNKQNATVEIKNGKFDLKSIDVENTNTTVTISGGKFKNIEIAGKYLDNKAFDTEADADGYYAVMAHPITGIGLSIGEDISLRVIVRNGYQDGKLFYSYIDANGNPVEEKATIGKDTKGNYVFRIYNINPQRAGTIYTLRYEDKAGNTVGALKEASILTYLEGLYTKKIENETATKEAARKVYIANFLEYCAAAATRAYPDDESRTQAIRDLMNKLGLEVTHFTLDEDHAGETYNDNAEKVFTGLGIEYGSIMRIYYAVSEEAYNAGYVYKQAGHVISNPIEIVEGKNGKEYRLYLNIPPYEYFSGQTITVEDSEGNTICVYSCPMGRILLRFSNTEKYEEKVTSVARAAFDYCAALKAYLRSK